MYTFPTANFRAQCLNVVDGDTVDLFVDCGFHSYKKERFRVLGIDTPELRSSNPTERLLAQQAKAETTLCLKPTSQINLSEWPLRIVSHKADSFGRYLADIFFMDTSGVEISLATHLKSKGF